MLFRIVYAMAIGFIFMACANDLDLVAPKEDIPIVYGILCPLDTAQYIRLERAFIDENTAAGEIAKIPDSLYYPDAAVSIIQLSSNQVYVLERVDGADEGFERNTGFFAEDPNFLYKIKTSEIQFSEGEEYLLQINTGEQLIATASTVLLDPPLITRPSSSSRLDFSAAGDFNIRWNPDESTRFADILIAIRINEIDRSEASPEWESKILWWTVETLIEDTELSRPGSEFYRFLEDTLKENSQISRQFVGLDVYVNTSGDELYNYISAGQATLGLTSSLDLPPYTNLSRGYGIFTSKASSVRRNIQITPGSLDSLKTGQFTRDLNFL